MSKNFVSESHFIIRSSAGLFWAYYEQWSKRAIDSMIFTSKTAATQYRRKLKLWQGLKIAILTVTVRDVTEEKASKA